MTPFSYILTFIIFILPDREPPTCGFCPPDITIDNATELQVRVNWRKPKCSDNSGIPPEVISNKQSGSFFGVPSASEVTYTVSDESNNQNKNCHFRITIRSECWSVAIIIRDRINANAIKHLRASENSLKIKLQASAIYWENFLNNT